MEFFNQESEIIKTTSPWQIASKFSHLPKEEWEKLKKHGKILHFQKNSVVIEADSYIDKIYFINKGHARSMLINSEGEEKVLFYTNVFIALECFFHEQPCSYVTIAMEDMEIFAIDRTHVEELMESKAIRDLLFKALSIKCRVLGWQIEDLSLSNPMKRICRLICSFIATDEQYEFLPLTHQEMSQLTGLHRVTVSKTISQLKQMEVIDTDSKGHIIVKDWEALKEIGFEKRF